MLRAILHAWNAGLKILRKKTKLLKSRNELVKKYMEDKEKDEDIRNIARHTIGEVDPAYDLKHIQKRLKSIYN